MATIAVAATAPFGADVLAALAQRHDVAYVLTRPDRRQGRGRRVAASPAKEAAERLGLEVRQPEGLDGFDPGVATLVAVAYGLLVPTSLLERALWLNVHPSLLPRWRGAAPVERALMAGDPETGVTIIKLVPELDAGPVAAQRAFAVRPEDDAGAVYAQAAEGAVELLDGVLPEPEQLDEQRGEATYAAKIEPADRELDWSRPADELHNRIRALSPHIGARGVVDGRRLIVWRSRVRDGELELVEVQPDGGRRMTYEEYLRGRR